MRRTNDYRCLLVCYPRVAVLQSERAEAQIHAKATERGTHRPRRGLIVKHFRHKSPWYWQSSGCPFCLHDSVWYLPVLMFLYNAVESVSTIEYSSLACVGGRSGVTSAGCVCGICAGTVRWICVGGGRGARRLHRTMVNESTDTVMAVVIINTETSRTVIHTESAW